MSRNSKYDELLLQESKRGRNNSYINLSIIYLQKIFSLAFELVPIKDEAIRITSEVFCEVWRELEKVSNLLEFIKILEKTTAIKCVDYLNENNPQVLNDDLINKLNDELNSPILMIEREILKLSSFERAVIILFDQIGFKSEIVKKLYKDKELSEILDALNRARQKLIRKIPSENHPKFTEEQWEKINLYLKSNKNEHNLTGSNVENLISDYKKYSAEIMQDLLRLLLPDKQIIENLRSFIFEEDTKKSKIEKSDEYLKSAHKRVNTNKLQSKSSNKNGLKIAISFFLIIIVTASFWFISNIPSEWNILGEISFVKLNGGKAIRNELKEGDRISTSEVRKANISFDKLATVEILENSEFIIGKTTSKESNVELKTGAINFNSVEDLDQNYNQDGIDYKLKFQNATLSTKQSKFNLSLYENNEFYLALNVGWLSLQLNKFNRNVYLANNYNLKFNNSFLTVLPYHKKSSTEFMEAIDEISKIPTDANSFLFIINNADERDVLTLWHLLSISDSNKVKLVLEKLDKLLLLDLVEEYEKASSISEVSKQKLLKFIINDLLMRND